MTTAKTRPTKANTAPTKPRDPRIPPVGTVIEREHQGKVHRIEVLEQGFRYAGKAWRSLSAIAKHVTGTTWNGVLWAGLLEKPKAQEPATTPAPPVPAKRRPGRPIAPRRTKGA